MAERNAPLYGLLLPHPPVLVPSVGSGRELEAETTLRGMDEAAEGFAAFAPETVVVISPHAPLFRDYLFMYRRNPLRGSFASFGAAHTELSFTEDSEFAEALLQNLSGAGIPAGSDVPAAADGLDHGVLVPLWFLSRRMSDFKLVAISQSALPERDILAAGACIAETASRLSRRTCIVASGDMSHRVNRSSPYGMRSEGAKFDEAVCRAFRELDPAAVRSIDPSVREGAGECGYRSIVMLEGAMPKAVTRLLSYEAPFGIGYCAAEFKNPEESR